MPKRTSPAKLYLFRAKSVSLEDVIRKITLTEGEKQEASGSVRRVFDSATRELRGFQLVSAEAARMDQDLRSIKTTASISSREMQLNMEYSRTFGLAEERREERIANGLPPEDEAERTQAKIRVYPFIGAARGDILRVWPR
jgi:hypothetical protein